MQRGRRDAGQQEERPRSNDQIIDCGVWMCGWWPCGRVLAWSMPAVASVVSGQWACVGSFKMPHDVCVSWALSVSR